MQTISAVSTGPEKRANALLGGAGFGALCIGVKVAGPALATVATVPVAAVGAGVASGLLVTVVARVVGAKPFAGYAVAMGAATAALFAALRLYG